MSEQGGTKLDQGKHRMELLSPIAITELSQVLTHGAKKYADHNWRKGLLFSRILAAILRHTFARLRGEKFDPETGLTHAAHIMAEAMFLSEFEATKPGLDDTYQLSSDNSKESLNCPNSTNPTNSND